MEEIKIKKGALLGRYFKSLDKAIDYYNKMSKEIQERQSVIQFADGQTMIVGNSEIEAIKI